MSQLAYSTDLTKGRAGMLAELSPKQVDSKLADGLVQVGILALIGDNLQGSSAGHPGQVKKIPAQAVDVDAIVTTAATAATPQTISGAGLNGVVGAGLMTPARRITMTLNSHADWNETQVTIEGLDADGEPIEEQMAVPDAGNVTLTSAQYFSRVTFIHVAAQGGTNGSYTFGTSADEGMLAPGSYGVALWDSSREPLTAADEYTDKTDVPFLRKGRVWVVVEAAVSEGNPAFVRMVESGADFRGQFRGSPATGFSPLPGCFFKSDAGVDGLAILELV